MEEKGGIMTHVHESLGLDNKTFRGAVPFLGPRLFYLGRERPRLESQSHYRRIILYVSEKAGVPKRAPNLLLRLYASEIRGKYGLEAAQIMLRRPKADATGYTRKKNEKNGKIQRKKVDMRGRGGYI